MIIKTLTVALYKTQFFRFVVVGSLAALTNIIVLFFIIKFFQLNPLLANLSAFLLAFQVSYWGHRSWTFNHKRHNQYSAVKFCLVALIGFSVNEGIFACFLYLLQWNYLPAITLTLLLVAVGTFISSKLWAFR